MKYLLSSLVLVISCCVNRCCYHPFEDIYTSRIENTIYKAQNCPQDEFHASTLIGVWQFDYNVSIGSYELKEVEFFSDGYCDIVIEEKGTPNRYTRTFHWFINNGYLNFDSGSTYDERWSFAYKLKHYLYPILTIEDCYGVYEMKKVKI